MTVRRPDGDDAVILVRVRARNLPALREGVALGVDDTIGSPIVLRLAEGSDGTYAIEVVTNPIAMSLVPEPVSPEGA